MRLYSRYDDRIEPPEPEKHSDGDIVGRCPFCGKPICYGDNVHTIEGIEQMIHEDCMVFKKLTPAEMLDLLGVDRYKVAAAEIYEEGY